MNTKEILTKYRKALEHRQLAPSTVDQYLEWASRFSRFCRSQPKNSPARESPENAITEFLSSLTPCSVANQKGALNALAGKSGLYEVLGRPIAELPQWVNARRPERVPVWVTQSEAEAIISHLSECWQTMAGIMFGSGLRIGEAIDLRWRAFDFERGTVSVRSGKGDKCRIAPLSARLLDPLIARRERCRKLWEEDRRAGRPGVSPVPQLVRKFPSHGEEWPFFWVFPSAKESRDPASGIIRRHHIHPKSMARPLREAVRKSKIDKRVTAHSFRHGFATAYLLAGGNLRELQTRMGHASIETTMRYLHCLPQEFDRIGSPWDVTTAQPARNVTPFRRTA